MEEIYADLLDQDLEENYPKVLEFMREDGGESVGQSKGLEVVRLYFNYRARATVDQDLPRTHTFKGFRGAYTPLNLTPLLMDPPLYVQLLAMLSSVAVEMIDLRLTEVFVPTLRESPTTLIPHPSHCRLFLDVDTPNLKAPVPQPTCEMDKSPEAAFNALLDEIGFGRSACCVFKKRSSYSFHVVFRDLLFNPSSDESSKAAVAFMDLIRTKLASHYSLDVECTKRGTLRLPGQFKPHTHPSALDFYFLNTNVYRGSSMVLGSIWATDQARNPVLVEDLMRSRMAPVRMQFQQQGTTTPALPAAPRNADTQPSWLSETLKLNDPRTFLAMVKQHEFGADFLPKDAPPPSSILLVQEIYQAVSQLGFGSSATDVELEILKVFNKHFAWISRQAIIITRNYSVLENDVEFGYWQQGVFASTFKNVVWKGSITVAGKDGKEVKRNKVYQCAKIWLEHPARRTYTDVVFNPYPRDHPTGPKADQFNSYIGWAWTKDEILRAYDEDLNPQRVDVVNAFQKHIFNVLCNRDHQKFQWFMCLLCKKIRQPWFRPDSCAVFTGNEGSGKTTVFDFLLAFAGKCGAKCTDVEQLLGNFNAEYRNKLIVYLDEASWAGAIRNNNQLKTFITSSTQRTEQKYRDSQVSPNYTMMFMTANDHVVVRQGEHARRWALFSVRLNSARGNPDEHRAYFDKLYQMPEDNWTCMKIWLAQFYQEDLYPSAMLQSFGTFANHTFPMSCIQELESQKNFSMGSISKYWQMVLQREYTYRPHLDYNLNASDKKEFVFSNTSKAPHAAVVSDIGRTLEDVLPEPGKNFKDLKSIMDAIRNPGWKPGRTWLGTVNLKLVYEDYKFCVSNNLIVARKGVEDNIDYSAFEFTTERIFTSLLNQEGPPRKFRYFVKAEWKQRSAARAAVNSDMEWIANYRHNTTDRGKFYDENMVYLTLGSLDDCKEAFYLHSGLDFTPNQRFKKKDLDAKPKIYNGEWADDIVNLFERI